MTHTWSHWEGVSVNGEFRLRKYLGGSEQTAVFLSEYGGPETQQAAIKLVRSDAANAPLQFDRWRMAQGLSHPHLLRIFQTGRWRLQSTDLIFVAMEYAEENLAQVVPQRQLTPTEVCQMLESILDALAYLHGHGLVYGRLSPASIMAIDDQLKLASDGLCKAGDLFATLGKGSPYDPPEKPGGRTSSAADMWSLGMTLAEALTQHLPSWNGLNQIDPALPADMASPLFDIVRGCLRRDPSSRLTIPDITAQLHPPVPPPAPPPEPEVAPSQSKSSEPQPSKSSKRNLIVPAIVAVLVLIALLAGLGRLLRRPPGRQDPSAVTPVDGRQTEQKTSDQTESRSSKTSAGHRIKPSPALARSSIVGNTVPADSQVVHQVLPEVSDAARNTVRGTVRVRIRVHVDQAGNVVGANFDSPGPSKYFARLSMQSSQDWKFMPAQNDGREFVVRFDFTSSGTKAFAVQAGQ